MDNVNVRFMVEDERPAVVLDDVDNAAFQNFSADIKSGVPVFVKVTNTKKRDADREYVLNYPYTTTSVTNLTTPGGLAVQDVTVARPRQHSSDTLYTLPTAPSAASPYSFAVPTQTTRCH
jgi:hypothetical protein